MSVQFRTALEPYGTWHHNRRFGDVWVPADVSSEWRPYTAGHWVYTDDYGWYWVADDEEADWGWITYHYGRWVRDAGEGWVWIPNDVWGPAWVDWRYGDQYVGWAPAPPDQYAAEDDPAYWSFVPAGDLIAPSIVGVLLPFGRRAEFFEHTRLVNRPVMTGGPNGRFAVNPGIAPATIAAIRGRSLPTYQVRPHVLAGTAAVPGAISVRAADLRGGRGAAGRTGARIATREVIQPTSTMIRPTRSPQQPQALARGEAGRLGDNPPRATRGATLQQGAGRVPGALAAQPRGEQRTTGAASGQATPNAPPRTTAQAPAAARPGAVEQPAGREGNQRPVTEQRRPAERTPLAHASAANQIHRAPVATARPQISRPPAVAARPPAHAAAPPRTAATPPPRTAAPPRAAAAPPPHVSAPRAAAVPPPRPAPPAAAARPAAPVTTGAAPRGGPGQKRQ
jgi:hypothetical protein